MADLYGVQASLTTSTVPSIVTVAGQALPANPARGCALIQNLGTNPLFVYMGTGASTTVFTLILKAASGTDDGSGGVWSMESATMWRGVITVAGTSPRFVASDFTA